VRAGDTAAAAAFLSRGWGPAALEDDRLAGWLRGSGQHATLARLCLEAGGTSARATAELRDLVRDRALPADLRTAVRTAVEAVDAGARREFEAGAGDWVAQARAEIDQRFAGIWALDLGTSTSVAAIYDGAARRAVPCPWKGNPSFPSTLSVDRSGAELVGLSGDELLAARLVGHVVGAKRLLGTATTCEVGERRYRPEEVVARLVRHGRELVEAHLAGKVRERVAELAGAAGATVRAGWLDDLEKRHDLRLPRPRALLTIPASFRNNQKHATRDACRIAGVQLVRLVHEPTAACVAATWGRRASGRVVVVDLGAGTLDVACIEADEVLHVVERVVGDSRYGGSDLDEVITRALVERLAQRGVEVPEHGPARHRVVVAAERLRIALSGQERADLLLRDLVEGHDVELALTGAELAVLLAAPLDELRRVCRDLLGERDERPAGLVLLGGPMLAPPVRAVVEGVFDGLPRVPVRDAATAVATGAALQAAALDQRRVDVLLTDVTPLPVSLRAPRGGAEQFAEVIAGHTHLPATASRTFTTARDGQSGFDFEVVNGAAEPAAEVGRFRFTGIAPAPAGVPQIEVTFRIDESCVLAVTAKDPATGRPLVPAVDSALLTPGEIEAMAARLEREAQIDQLRARLVDLLAEVAEVDRWAGLTEFDARRDSFRPRPGLPEPAVREALTEIFRGSGRLEGQHLRQDAEALHELAERARTYLEEGAGDRDAALAGGRHLLGGIREQLERLRERQRRVADWTALLARESAPGADALHRFRAASAAGDHVAAVAAAAEVDEPLSDAGDIEGWLRSLAATGQVEGYRAQVRAHAADLRVLLPATAAGRAAIELGPALAVVGQLGTEDRRSGFGVRDGVLTSGRWLADVPVVEVTVDDGPVRAVDPAGPEAVLVRPLRPLPVALRLGGSALLGVGDQVWAPAPGSLLTGVVDRFEGPLVRVAGVVVPPSSGGAPVLNDLGEVVGMVADTEHPAGATYVVPCGRE
jgi:molecular chaperone DnaK